MKIITNEIVKRFELYLYEEEKSDNTIEKYMRDIRFFREWLSGKPVFCLEYKTDNYELYKLKSLKYGSTVPAEYMIF